MTLTRHYMDRFSYDRSIICPFPRRLPVPWGACDFMAGGRRYGKRFGPPTRLPPSHPVVSLLNEGWPSLPFTETAGGTVDWNSSDVSPLALRPPSACRSNLTVLARKLFSKGGAYPFGPQRRSRAMNAVRRIC